MKNLNPSFEEAINATSLWCSAWDTGELSDEVLADRVSELLETINGARGFFAISLSCNSPLMDRLPDALIFQFREAGELVVDLIAKNLAMSSAMALHHEKKKNFDQQAGSENIKRRCLELLRRLEPNLVKESLEKIKNGLKEIKICGTENPGFGNYLGVVSDQELNNLYNSSKYLYLTSKSEGLGLTMIEAMICGSIPIACEDNETAKEFLPNDFICEPNSHSIVKKIDELNERYEMKRKIALEFGENYKIKFDKVSIAKNILKVFNSMQK